MAVKYSKISYLHENNHEQTVGIFFLGKEISLPVFTHRITKSGPLESFIKTLSIVQRDLAG
jgi:hypothetical protein